MHGRVGRIVVMALVAVTLGSCSGGGGDAGDEPRHAGRPPIVMIVFDEFSTVSLLDAHGRIDPVRYPNFAALARDATWFPYATASSDETGRALRSLFTGRTEWRFAKPSYVDEPRNLFTMLGRRYRMDVSEEASSLCPPRLCPGSHTLTAREVLHALGGGRPARFERWLRSVRPASRPTFYFKHLLLPHAPWIYFPTGQHYLEGTSEKGLSWDLWHYNRWLVNQDYQRHLIQVEFTDRLLGRLLARLRASNLYSRSMIVLTADNGESFGRLGNGHNFNNRNAGEIALTPLIVKRPFQQQGRIDRHHVRTIDVLPTIARVAHVRPGWGVEGRPLVGPGASRVPATTLLIERSGRRIILSKSDLHRRMAAALRLKLRLFGSDNAGPGLYGIGPFPDTHGTQVASWPILARGGTRAIVDHPARYRDVRLDANTLPLKVSGRLTGNGSRATIDVAIAINGTIAATAPTVAPHPNGEGVFSALVPRDALRNGNNALEVYAIERDPAGRPSLRPLTP
jgi:Sulfatase